MIFKCCCGVEIDTVEIRVLSEDVDDDVPEGLVSLVVKATTKDLTEEERKERMRREGGRCVETLFKCTQEGRDVRKGAYFIHN